MDAKFAELSSWCEGFRAKNGRSPTLWFDKVCINQSATVFVYERVSGSDLRTAFSVQPVLNPKSTLVRTAVFFFPQYVAALLQWPSIHRAEKKEVRHRRRPPVPSGFLVDDFYIAMKVFEKGGLAINDLEALCFESSPADISEEFRRKTRISAGNFANLAVFRHLLWPPFSSLAFAFFSHKVLRWYGPFFILISYLCAFILGFVYNSFFYVCFFALLSFCLFGIPVLDWLFKKINLNLMVLRYITYFNAMNLALFNGFFKYLKGVQNGIWEPTKRDL